MEPISGDGVIKGSLDEMVKKVSGESPPLHIIEDEVKEPAQPLPTREDEVKEPAQPLTTTEDKVKEPAIPQSPASEGKVQQRNDDDKPYALSGNAIEVSSEYNALGKSIAFQVNSWLVETLK